MQVVVQHTKIFLADYLNSRESGFDPECVGAAPTSAVGKRINLLPHFGGGISRRIV